MRAQSARRSVCGAELLLAAALLAAALWVRPCGALCFVEAQVPARVRASAAGTATLNFLAPLPVGTATGSFSDKVVLAVSPGTIRLVFPEVRGSCSVLNATTVKLSTSDAELAASLAQAYITTGGLLTLPDFEGTVRVPARTGVKVAFHTSGLKITLSTGPIGATIGPKTKITATQLHVSAGSLDVSVTGSVDYLGAAAALKLDATAALAGADVSGPGATLRITTKGVATFDAVRLNVSPVTLTASVAGTLGGVAVNPLWFGASATADVSLAVKVQFDLSTAATLSA